MVRILSNRCPRCREGRVFRGVMTLNKACSGCGLSFDRDLTGARWLSYYVLLFCALPVFFVLMLNEVDLGVTLGTTVGVALLVTPLTVRLTTLAVLYAESLRK